MVSKSNVPSKPLVEEAEALAASAAVRYFLANAGANTLEGLSLANGQPGSNWACAARAEAAGAQRISTMTQLARLFGQTSLKSFIAILLFAVSNCYASQSPAHAGLLSFFHHKKKHLVEIENEKPVAKPAADSGGAPLPTRPLQAPQPRSLSPKYSNTPSSALPTRRIYPPVAPAPPTPTVSPVRQDTYTAEVNQSLLDDKQHIIRIGVALNVPSLEVSTIDGAQIVDAQSGESLASLPAQSRWTAATINQALRLEAKPSSQLAFARSAEAAGLFQARQSTLKPVAYYQPSRPSFDLDQPLTGRSLDLPLNGSRTAYFVKPFSSGNQEGIVGVNGKLYRGYLCIQPSASGTSFNVINYLSVEDYLLSVVPSEMPSGWPLEALKAQAIAARSYAYANRGKHGSEGYDLKDNTEDQAYSGVKSEYDSTNLAVASTANLVLKYDGKPICAYFHSTSGGSTEVSENVWSKALPYLKAVVDYDDPSPHFSWNRRFSVDDIENKLAPGLSPILTVFVVSRSTSKRVSNLLVVGKGDARLFSGENVRRLLKLPSTNFNVFSSPGSYTFYGRGFGHGLGLSQWGSKTLAEQGYNAAQILAYYYKDIVVEPVTDYSGH